MIEKLKEAASSGSLGRLCLNDIIEAVRQLEQVEVMREALEYYANDHKSPNDGPWGANSEDFGKRARAALSQSKDNSE